VALPGPSTDPPTDGGGTAAAVVAVAAVPAARFVPQLPQNLAPGGFCVPHVGQPPSAVPHPMQKRPSDGFAVPQFWQITMTGE
jgi:hypothetical protein